MISLAKHAIDTAVVRGATYADARAMRIRTQTIVVKNGRVGSIAESESLGIGVRVIADGAWGFAATHDLSRQSVERVAAEAVAVGRASALVRAHEVRLAPVAAARTEWRTDAKIDPFAVSLAEKIDLLMRADGAMRRAAGVTVAEAQMQFVEEDQWYLSTEEIGRAHV